MEKNEGKKLFPILKNDCKDQFNRVFQVSRGLIAQNMLASLLRRREQAYVSVNDNKMEIVNK